tara:strand:+ start:101 stop:859 length:759 start_codon:yes stop_codon:yes gene_type:complete
MIEVLILSLIQGITEFLPVSSSSHLIIFSNFINFDSRSLSIDISLHIGSFLAVITFFYKDILDFIKNKNLFLKIVVSSLPVIFVGFLLVETGLIQELRNIKVIGWMTLIFGVKLYISDKFNVLNNIRDNFNYKNAIFIGLFQVFSLIPGVSRSGITITAARFLKFKRFDAAKISFLLSIPTLGAVSIFGLKNIFTSENLDFSILNYISILFSFVISFLTIKFFLNFVKKFSMTVFVVYRIVLGIIILIFAYL